MKNEEIKKLIHTNIKIFKENIKILFNSTIDQIGQNMIKAEFLNNFIIKEMNKGKFDEIEEECEQNDSDSHSITMTNNVG